MNQQILQDYISTCLAIDKKSFCDRLGVPVLIGEISRQSFGYFNRQHTQLTEMPKQEHSAKDLIRSGHNLPVFELRRRVAGPKGQIRVGRTEENDLVLTDVTVSSRHAVFQKNEQTGSYTIQDLASMNGTLVNGERLRVGKTVPLFDGDIVTIGTPTFLFLYPEGLFDVIRANLDSL